MIGRIISHYKIVDKLGEGGMGAVYRAEDMTLNRLVALKTLSPKFIQNKEARDRFIREAQAASAINHPNITTVFELLEEDDSHYISMEYVDGKTIRDMLESGRVSIRKAVDIVLCVAEALDAAHRKGILHRDVKSANIMVSMEGNVKVMDFGLAHIEERSQLTRTGTMMGTLAYSSPEQLTGHPYDIRSEIWSLGVVFYELVTGVLPFHSPSEGELLFAIINNEQEPPEKLRDDVPATIRALINRMLLKQPELRYQSCRELINDLKIILGELGTSTLKIGITPEVGRERSGRRARFAIIAATAMIGLAALYFLFLAPEPEEILSLEITDPSALFTIRPSSGNPNTSFAFDASGSSDSLDSSAALEIRWDWTNDDAWDTQWTTEKTATHNYGRTGTWTAKVEVRNSGGRTGTFSRQVTVSTAPNVAPTARLAADKVRGDTGTQFTFDASGSSDGEDPLEDLEVRWDWESDGRWDSGWIAEKTSIHRFARAGSYIVEMQIRDTSREWDDATLQIVVSEATEPMLRLSRPVGGETWQIGSTQQITWESEHIDDDVILELWQGGSASSVIESNTPNDGEYDWLITADDISPGSEYHVGIADASSGDVADNSYPPFFEIFDYVYWETDFNQDARSNYFSWFYSRKHTEMKLAGSARLIPAPDGVPFSGNVVKLGEDLLQPFPRMWPGDNPLAPQKGLVIDPSCTAVQIEIEYFEVLKKETDEPFAFIESDQNDERIYLPRTDSVRTEIFELDSSYIDTKGKAQFILSVRSEWGAGETIYVNRIRYTFIGWKMPD
ncbi:protein kinase [Gemmatimonadota bacterium]